MWPTAFPLYTNRTSLSQGGNSRLEARLGTGQPSRTVRDRTEKPSQMSLAPSVSCVQWKLHLRNTRVTTTSDFSIFSNLREGHSLMEALWRGGWEPLSVDLSFALWNQKVAKHWKTVTWGPTEWSIYFCWQIEGRGSSPLPPRWGHF